jgi:hypothetical protein
MDLYELGTYVGLGVASIGTLLAATNCISYSTTVNHISKLQDAYPHNWKLVAEKKLKTFQDSSSNFKKLYSGYGVVEAYKKYVKT